MYDKIKDNIYETTDQIKTNVYGKKNHKSFSFLFKDAIYYSFSRPVNLVLLGLFLVIVSFSNDLFKYALKLELFLPIIFLFLIFALVFSIYESGYSFIIFHKSLNGSDIPPSPLGLKEILHHGIKDFSVIIAYVIIMMIIQYIMSVIIHSQTNTILIIILSLLNYLIGGIYICVINLSLINLAIHDGDLIAAFDVFDFKKLFQNIGAWRFFLVLVILSIIDLFTGSIFSMDYALGINIISDIIILFILTPAMTLFTKRFLVMAVMH